MLKVEGAENKAIYSGKLRDDIYQPEGQVSASAAAQPAEVARELSKPERIRAGELVFNQTCFACHQASGLGMPGIFPPLAKSDFLMADADRAIGIVLHGKQGEIKVNGVTYNQIMTPQNLTDEQIANVLTFVMNTWGNEGEMITPDRVRKVRAAGGTPAGQAHE